MNKCRYCKKLFGTSSSLDYHEKKCRIKISGEKNLDRKINEGHFYRGSPKDFKEHIEP